MPLDLSKFGQLKKQVIARFFMVTLIFSALSSLGFVIVTKQDVQQLQSIDMSLAIERIRHQYLKGENVGRANRFFHAPKSSTQFPEWLRHLPEGFHKIKQDHLIWHVMVVDYPDQRYILLRDYTTFEGSQLSALGLSALILSASLLLSLTLIYIANSYIIKPIEKLEKSIRNGLNPTQQNQLAANYPHNEIGQLAAAFDEVYDQLNKALQRERLFTADVSHELRTPLMVILSSCELLQATASQLPEKSKLRLTSIQQSAQRILQQLQIYLALARQNPNSASGLEQQNLSKIAQRVLQDNQNFARNYQVNLNLIEAVQSTDSYPADLCYTVMSNLIRNAIEYAGHGSQIVIVINQHGFYVKDDGSGIESALQPNLFEAFSGSQQSNHHLGLGLSLVQRICEYLNWKIEFSSSHEHGTCFTILTKSNLELHSEPNKHL